MTAAAAFGTKLYRETTPGSGASGTTGYTLVGGLTNLSMPELMQDFAESTEMTAAGAVRTRVPTLRDLGQLTADLNYDSSEATQAQIQSDWAAGTSRKYKVIGTDAGADDVAFDAYVARFKVEYTRDGLSTASLALQPSGPRTQT